MSPVLFVLSAFVKWKKNLLLGIRVVPKSLFLSLFDIFYMEIFSPPVQRRGENLTRLKKKSSKSLPPFQIFSLPVLRIKKNLAFSNSHFFFSFFFLITEFWFVLVFNFIKLSYFLFIPPPLLLEDSHFAFTTQQILKFSWKITVHWSLPFPGTVVYFLLMYVFRDENLLSIWNLSKLSPYHFSVSPSPPAQLLKITHHESFHFLFIYILKFLFVCFSLY